MTASTQTVEQSRKLASDLLNQVAWTPKGDLDRREWLEIGRTLGRLGRYNRWWVGDWLLYAIGKWGEMYTEATRITGFDYGSLRNMASVAREFDLSRRRDKLSWTHHADVAALEYVEQEYWLDRAVELGLTREDLRVEIRAARRIGTSRHFRGSTGADSGVNVVVCPKCGDEVPVPASVVPPGS